MENKKKITPSERQINELTMKFCGWEYYKGFWFKENGKYQSAGAQYFCGAHCPYFAAEELRNRVKELELERDFVLILTSMMGGEASVFLYMSTTPMQQTIAALVAARLWPEEWIIPGVKEGLW